VDASDAALIALGLAVAIIGPTNDHLAFREPPAPLWAATFLGTAYALIVMILLAAPSYAPFIYFQF
jgi:hypothetical protein